MRKVLFTSPTRDMQILKAKGSSNLIYQAASDDQTCIYRFNRSKKQKQPKLWARFNNATGDGIKIFAGIFEGFEEIVSGSCLFNISCLFNRVSEVQGSLLLDWLAQPATISFILLLFHFAYMTLIYPNSALLMHVEGRNK